MLGLPDAAEYFQKAGVTCLVYDPRSTGLSDGLPRNDIDPIKQVGDTSDALSFLGGLSSVDSSKVGLWGMSFGAVVSLCAAAVDKRAKFAIAVCPMTDFEYTPEKRVLVLGKCIKDRESQLLGNPPFYLPMVTEKGENPVGFGSSPNKTKYAELVRLGKEIAPNHVNRTTLQTYYKMFMWQPFSLWRHLSPTPTMMIVPELDTLSPAEEQIQRFDILPGPKKLHVQHALDHEDILIGEHLHSLMRLQMDFINDALECRIVS